MIPPNGLPQLWQGAGPRPKKFVILGAGKEGDYPMPAETLYIDCTATAVERRPVVPQFQDGLITLQMIRVPQPAFSAALSAFLEVTYDDDETKNRLG